MKRMTIPALLLASLVGFVSTPAGSPAVLAATASAVPTSTNLARNATITTQATQPDAYFAQAEQTYSVPLTNSTGWEGFQYQGSRNITIHLPQASTVTNLSLQFHQDASLGVFYPSSADFQVRHNGVWYSIGTAHAGIPQTDKRVTNQVFSVQTSPIVGQDFRIHFPVGVWVFARNLTIHGMPWVSATAENRGIGTLPPIGQPIPNFPGPLNANNPRSHGIQNMLLMSSMVRNSEADFLPMIGHVTPGGQITGRMFDTILFAAGGNLPDNATNWQAYMQHLFTAGDNLSALDSAVAKVNQTLGTPGYKEKVILTIPYPAFGDGAFGNVNGVNLNFNGSPQDPNAVVARTSAMRWFVTALLAQWNRANYSHLQLTGLYWEQESAPTQSPGELSLIQHAATLAHANNLPLFWIPFYGAQHARSWTSTGFDAVWLQPNFVELGTNANVSRLGDAAQMANQYGMGLEMELVNLNPISMNLYQASLRWFEQDAMAQNASHAFYDDAHLLYDAANSSNPIIRALYDNTYQFIQQTN